ncbi:3020_t:CDS:1, partial [Acaulospora morrowiae]
SLAINYDIGDKVLMYCASKQNSRSAKFEDKWTGPLYVHDQLPNNVYKLRTLDGKVLATPINTKILRPYWD